MEDPQAPDAPAVQPVRCPHCLTPLTSVGWQVNAEVGLVTIYHNEPGCMVALNCQMVPVERPRIELPQHLRPVGRG